MQSLLVFFAVLVVWLDDIVRLDTSVLDLFLKFIDLANVTNCKRLLFQSRMLVAALYPIVHGIDPVPIASERKDSCYLLASFTC